MQYLGYTYTRKVFLKILFIYFLREDKAGEKERVKNIYAGDKHLSVTSWTPPNHRLNLQPRHMPWPGIELATFHFTGQCPNQPSHTSQGLEKYLSFTWNPDFTLDGDTKIYLASLTQVIAHGPAG